MRSSPRLRGVQASPSPDVTPSSSPIKPKPIQVKKTYSRKLASRQLKRKAEAEAEAEGDAGASTEGENEEEETSRRSAQKRSRSSGKNGRDVFLKEGNHSTPVRSPTTPDKTGTPTHRMPSAASTSSSDHDLTPNQNVTPSKLPPPTTPTKTNPKSQVQDIVETVQLASPAQSDASIPSQMSSASASASASASGSGSGSQNRINRPPRMMLTKSQSLGHVPSTPSRLRDNQTPERRFGSDMGSITPSKTPSKLVSRTTSLPDTPSRSSGGVIGGSPRSSPGMAIRMTGARNGVAAGGGDDLSNGNSGGGMENEQANRNERAIPEVRSGGGSGSGAGSGGRAQRTYGRNRSFLAERGFESTGVDDPEKNLGGRDEGEIESYSELRKRYEVDNGETGGQGNLMADLVSARAPQPVSDMRSKGENRRFMDEIGFLVDGIRDPSATLGFKRSSSADILVNMQDESWLTKMRLCGQTERIWLAFSLDSSLEDETMDIICLLFLSIIIQSGEFSAVVPAHGRIVLEICLRVLRRGNGVLEAVTAQSSATIIKVRTLTQELDVGWASNVPCARRLASFVLLALTREESWPVLRQASENVVVEAVIESLAREIRRTCDRYDLYEMGHTMSSPEDPTDPDYLLQLLRIISTAISGSLEDRETLAEAYDHLPTDIVNSVIAMTSLALATDGQIKVIAANCAVEALQVLANMGSITPIWTEKLAVIHGGLTTVARILLQRDELSAILKQSTSNPNVLPDNSTGHPSPPNEADEGQIPNTSDGKSSIAGDEILCIVLALLTTTVLSWSMAGEAIATLKIGPRCIGYQACLRSCQCKDAQPLGIHLVEIYLQQLNLGGELNANIMTGYLALLLSKLMIASPSTQTLLASKLPGLTEQEKIKGLITSLKELTELQSVVHRKLGDMARGLEDTSAVEHVGDGVDAGIATNGEGLDIVTGREVLEKDGDVLEKALEDLRDLIK